MESTPRFQHDCDACVFLGHAHGSDLYAHPRMPGSRLGLIARRSSEEEDYESLTMTRADWASTIIDVAGRAPWMETAFRAAESRRLFPEPLVHACTVGNRMVPAAWRHVDGPLATNIWFWPGQGLWLGTYNDFLAPGFGNNGYRAAEIPDGSRCSPTLEEAVSRIREAAVKVEFVNTLMRNDMPLLMEYSHGGSSRFDVALRRFSKGYQWDDASLRAMDEAKSRFASGAAPAPAAT